ncbi:MAG: phage tail protein, partial [archaeon]
YEVRGEDLLDVIAVLFGFYPPEYKPPWSTYYSQQGTNLLQFLKFTLYYYRYATSDNFYAKHIFDFIPEYDRNYILSQPKMKLFLEGIGRNLDNIEDKISRIPELYDLDKVPEELLDYVGQILGYEKEDFTLANLSFRELLKNIIEIYKIKGTNYSFSFFFKFLGFDVNLKEFYFNRDVKNPESFPGIDETKVEYYLTTKNPIFDTSNNNPADHLDQIRNLNEWEYEYEALKEGGCDNIINYMTGKETYNNNNERWHSNPWRYFKSNLIEYQLDPFLDKINLTASDNETIKKYITFLSPTYLFTWVNINLAPWVDTYDVHVEMEEKLNIEFHKTMGDYVDPETGDIYLYNTMQNSLEKIRDKNYFFQSYEDMQRYLNLYEKETNYKLEGNKWVEVGDGEIKGNVEFFNDLPSDAEEGDVYHVWGGERLRSSIVLNEPKYGDTEGEAYTGYDSSDRVGSSLRRDGTHIRQKNHPNYVDNVKHNGTINLSFDNLGIFIKDNSKLEYDYSVPDYDSLPDGHISINSIAYVENEEIYYIYKEKENIWKEIYLPHQEFVSEIVETEDDLPSTQQELEQVELGEIYYINDTNKYKKMVGGDTLWEDFNVFVETYKDEKIVKGDVTFESQLVNLTSVEHEDIYYIGSIDKFYQYLITEPQWFKAKGEDKYVNWEVYSFRPFPDVPTNVDPYPGTTLYTNNPVLSWNDVSNQNGFNLEVSYSLNFGKTDEEVSKEADGIPDNDEIVIEEILDTETTTLQLENISNNNYYWRVRTKNELDEFGEWSNIFRFTVDALPHPFDGEELRRETENVSIVYDEDEISSIKIIFKWEEVFEAEQYMVEISATSGFENILPYTADSNSIDISLPNNKTWYWRVKSLQHGEWTTAMDPHLFKTRF